MPAIRLSVSPVARSLRPLRAFACAAAAILAGSASLATAQSPAETPAHPSQAAVTRQVDVAWAEDVGGIANCLRVAQPDLLVEAIRNPRVLVMRGSREAVDGASAQLHELQLIGERQHVEQLERERAEAAEELAEAERSGAKLLDVDFGGGTLTDYVAHIAKLAGFSNVVMGDPGIGSLKVPPVQLRGVTAVGAVAILESLRFAGAGGDVSIIVSRLSGDPDGMAGGMAPVFVVNLAEPERAQPMAVRTAVIDLGPLARHEPDTLKGLLEAINVAMELNGRSSEFMIKFHGGTGLLFARGTADDLAMVQETVETMMGRSGESQ